MSPREGLLLQALAPDKELLLCTATCQGSGLLLYSSPWSYSQSSAMMPANSFSAAEPEPLLSATLSENQPPLQACQRKSFCHTLQKERNNKEQSSKSNREQKNNTKINKIQSFVKKINKINKPLARLRKKREDSNYKNQK